MAEVRDTTRRALTAARSVVRPSVIPSARYWREASPERFRNGSTTTDCMGTRDPFVACQVHEPATAKATARRAIATVRADGSDSAKRDEGTLGASASGTIIGGFATGGRVSRSWNVRR